MAMPSGPTPMHETRSSCMYILSPAMYAHPVGVMYYATAVRAFIICLAITFCGTASRAESIIMSLADARIGFGRHLPNGKDAAFHRS